MNRRLEIKGLVQGVGFRPFIYQLAHHHQLKGSILNNPSGVSIVVEGREKAIKSFIKELQKTLPPLARIDSLEVSSGSYAGIKDFKILQSDTLNDKTALVSPDIATCDNCLKEMSDTGNRRYGYPFINCTDCGPRYSIMQTIPYDRPNTSMNDFRMCRHCHTEYHDPLDRRFHAQPISCPDCGPKLSLKDHNGREIVGGNAAILSAIESIKEGGIVAVKGLGGFHLICDANNANAISELRRRKQRPTKPFAVMFPDINMIKHCADVSVEEEALITSKEKPIVIVKTKNSNTIDPLVAPAIDRIGVFLPYTPLHTLLLNELKRPLVATSANMSDEPIIRNCDELVEKLGSVIDMVLDHDRDILNANDDSVVHMAGDEKISLRLSRGYAPQSMKLPFKSKKKILAVGANQKNSLALIFEETIILSPYIGDLNSLEAFEYFERTLNSFKRFYDFEPEVIVFDKHPEYMTTKWAKQLTQNDSTIEVVEVQHHYAHLLSAMAEFRLGSKVLGFAFDGTGYGDDGTIWGGEVMIADDQEYQRICTLSSFRLLGGEKAIKEPRRSALALLFEVYTLEELERFQLSTLDAFSRQEIQLLHHAWKEEINAPRCSSMGRLFDAVASMADIIHITTFEGESGLLMEQYVNEHFTKTLPFSIDNGIIDLKPMIKAMVTMNDTHEIVSSFFNTLVEIIFQLASEYREMPILFSGGVFQNRVLVEKISRRCKEEGLKYYFQNETAVNDGGIALGQAWHALHKVNTV